MANSVILGTLVRLTAEFRVPAADDGTPTDPTTLTLQIRVPAGSLTSYTYLSGDGVIVKDATGFYHADYVPAATGRYRWRWAGVGAAHVAGEGGFVVTASTL